MRSPHQPYRFDVMFLADGAAYLSNLIPEEGY